MEDLYVTTAFPKWRKPEIYNCGAFYNLYKVMGCDNHNGVPATDTNSIYEREDMRETYRRIYAQMEAEKPERISIDQMITEVDKFLSKEFKL